MSDCPCDRCTRALDRLGPGQEIADLKAIIAAVEAVHRPTRDDDPHSLVDWTYCSCGAMSYRDIGQGTGRNEMAQAPVEYDRCPTMRALRVEPHE